MIPLPSNVVLAVALGVTLWACGDSSAPATPGATVTDSLGIVVRTYGHTDAHLELWGVDPEPVLQIGSLAGETPDVFGRITSLRITPDGGVVVSDALAGEIRTFAGTGEHLQSLGGLGEGPGEFSNSLSVLHVSADSIWAWDQRQQRVSVFAGGAFATSWNAPGDLVLSNTVLVGSRVFGPSSVRLAEPPESGMHRLSVHFVVADETGTATRLFEIEGHETYLNIRYSDGEITNINVFQPPFARGPFFGVVASSGVTRIIGGSNDRLVLREWSEEGEPLAEYRYPDMDRPVTAEVIGRARQRILDRYDEPAPQMTQELATLTSEVPEYLPAFDRVRGDDEGRVWLRRSAEDGVEEWTVLSLENLSPLARVVLPPGFALLDAREGLLGGYWLDELDVSHVRTYRLRKGQ